jgi:hypothetical protein
MTGFAANKMGIDGYAYEKSWADARYNKDVNAFLKEIHGDSHGAGEQLYHSFSNIKGTQFNVGDTFKVPLMATTGEQYPTYGDDSKAPEVIFRMGPETKIAAYDENKGQDRKDAGYRWGEAVTSGEFTVTAVHDEAVERPSSYWEPKTIKVVDIKQTKTFDPSTGRWS